jgi:hypothetical protein
MTKAENKLQEVKNYEVIRTNHTGIDGSKRKDRKGIGFGKHGTKKKSA